MSPIVPVIVEAIRAVIGSIADAATREQVRAAVLADLQDTPQQLGLDYAAAKADAEGRAAGR